MLRPFRLPPPRTGSPFSPRHSLLPTLCYFGDPDFPPEKEVPRDQVLGVGLSLPLRGFSSFKEAERESQVPREPSSPIQRWEALNQK